MSTNLVNKSDIDGHKVVSEKEWIEAGKALLVKEKELTHFRAEVSAMRREMPWVRVEKDYVFDGPDGKVSLAELFGNKSQLAAYQFMFEPGETIGCSGCSFICDHVDSARQHFEHNDLAFVAVSRGKLSEFEPFKKRMGWKFNWVSSNGNDFSYDMSASFRREDLDAGPVLYNFSMQKLRGESQPGITFFYKNEKGEIFRTYSVYERGLDALIGAYHYLDLAPKGRNESGPMSWMKRHDEYEG